MTAAGDEIRKLVDELNEKYPTAKFSYGYLFNHPCDVEHQQWYIFTQVPTPKPASDGFVTRFKYSCSGRGHQDQILEDLRSDRFLRWLVKLEEHIDSPRHQWWHQKIHINDCPECGAHNRFTTGSRRAGPTDRVPPSSRRRRYFGEPVYIDVCNCLACGHSYDKAA